MIVEFGINLSDPKTINKKITWYTAKTPVCFPYDNCTLLSPVLILDYDPNIVNQNYMRIAEWKRCYFVVFEVITGGKMICRGSVDSLQSWAAYLNNTSALMARGSDIESRYLPDQYRAMKTLTQVENYQFDYTPFSTDENETGNYVLTVIGGATT